MRTAESCSSYGPPPGVDFALPAVLRTGCGLDADRPCLAPAFWRERGSACGGGSQEPGATPGPAQGGSAPTATPDPDATFRFTWGTNARRLTHSSPRCPPPRTSDVKALVNVRQAIAALQARSLPQHTSVPMR